MGNSVQLGITRTDQAKNPYRKSTGHGKQEGKHFILRGKNSGFLWKIFPLLFSI
jgi:hypothetical protein